MDRSAARTIHTWAWTACRRAQRAGLSPGARRAGGGGAARVLRGRGGLEAPRAHRRRYPGPAGRVVEHRHRKARRPRHPRARSRRSAGSRTWARPRSGWRCSSPGSTWLLALAQRLGLLRGPGAGRRHGLQKKSFRRKIPVHNLILGPYPRMIRAHPGAFRETFSGAEAGVAPAAAARNRRLGRAGNPPAGHYDLAGEELRRTVGLRQCRLRKRGPGAIINRHGAGAERARASLATTRGAPSPRCPCVPRHGTPPGVATPGRRLSALRFSLDFGGGGKPKG